MDSFGIVRIWTTNIDWSNSYFLVETNTLSFSNQLIRMPCMCVYVSCDFLIKPKKRPRDKFIQIKQSQKSEQNLQVEYFVLFKQELILSAPVERKKVQEPTTPARNILNETKETGGEMIKCCSVKKLKK